MIFNNKKAAVELSVGTMVVVVLGITMLILGLVLVKNIFSGAGEATELVNQNLKAEINKLFNNEDTKIVIYLPDATAEVEKGKRYNIRFGIKNIVRGESQAGQFSYNVQTNEVESGCSLSLEEAETYLRTGRSSSNIQILPGDEPKERVIVFEPDEKAPLCIISYDITVKKDGEFYDESFFNVIITG
jgi:hypothetical protein